MNVARAGRGSSSRLVSTPWCKPGVSSSVRVFYDLGGLWVAWTATERSYRLDRFLWTGSLEVLLRFLGVLPRSLRLGGVTLIGEHPLMP